MNTTLDLDGHSYQIGRLDAFKQFHVARRIAPIMMSLGVSLADLAQRASDKSTAEVLPELLGPVAGVLAKMSDEEVNYVLLTCLSACARVQGGALAKVVQGNSLMFQDINMPTMIQLAIATVQENLSDFFPMLPAVTPSPAASGTSTGAAT